MGELISIEKLQTYYQQDKVFATQHASERCRQRGIRTRDIRKAVMTGIIIEQYPDDFPFPSCLICGETEGQGMIHVVMSDEGTGSRIITAYFPDPERWDADLKIRKE
ncbi:MAG: DUF4258 domain-containing protein [Lachnospiraceae bacterium]|nr:DUF4258 domain-containing protein [Lachnospiraceae bacterium]